MFREFLSEFVPSMIVLAIMGAGIAYYWDEVGAFVRWVTAFFA